MPASKRSFSPKEAAAYLLTQTESFVNAGRVGAEIEWLTIPIGEPHLQADFDQVHTVLPKGSEMPAGGRVSYEPGGQLEISTVPAGSADAVCEAIAVDASYAQSILYEEDIELVGVGYEPIRQPNRVVRSPRYDAMEAYFDGFDSGAEQGRSMMRCTAAIQVNVDLPADPVAGWRLAHVLGPTLAAAFANSPLAAGRPTGWHSTRLAVWQAIDPSRTIPALTTGNPASDWARYALDARVMFIEHQGPSGPGGEPIVVPMTFGQWIQSGHELGYPTLEDFQTHLTTLFPPVRMKQWLEMRMIDALGDPWWQVPILIVKALMHDKTASAAAARAASDTVGLWSEAPRDGLNHPALRASAAACFEIAAEVLQSRPSEYSEVVEAFNEQYIRRGRTLADETLESWRKQASSRAGRAAALREDRIEQWA